MAQHLCHRGVAPLPHLFARDRFTVVGRLPQVEVLAPRFVGGVGVRLLVDPAPLVDLGAGVGLRGVRVGHHVGDEAFIALLVLADDDRRLRDAGVGRQHLLDLAQFDAQPADLDLEVGAAEVLDLAVLVPAHEVAGAVHPGAGRAVGGGDEPLGGQGGLPEVAAGQAGAGEVQLTGDSGRDRAQCLVEDVDLGVPDGCADRHGVRAGDVLPGGDLDGGLGGAVEVVGAAAREEFDEAVGQCGGERLGGDLDPAQGGALLRGGFGDELRQQGGHEVRAGHPFPRDQLGKVGRVLTAVGAGDDDGRAHLQVGEQFGYRRVEARRGAQQHPVLDRDIEVRQAPLDPVHDRAVRDRYALGAAGGAGGVDDVGDVVGRQRALRVGLRLAGHLREVRVEDEQGLGAVEHLPYPVLGQVRVDRHVGRAGLHHRVDGDHQVDGPGNAYDDQLLRSRALLAQPVRQLVGPPVELAVAHALPLADHRDAFGIAAHLRLERVRQRDRIYRVRGVVDAPDQPLPLRRRHHLDLANRCQRGGGQLLQHTGEPGGDGFDGVAVEELGGVHEVALERARVVHGHAEEQVEHGGRHEVLLELDLEAGEFEVLLGEVLPGERHLEQWLVGGGAVGVDLLDQHLEGHVLVFVGRQGLVADLCEEVGEGRVAGEVHPQHLGVDEDTDQIGERLVGAPGDRVADGDVLLAAELAQQHRERRLEDHRHGHPAFVGQALESGGHLRPYREADRVAAQASLRGARTVQRQAQRLWHTGEFVAPVRGLGRGEAARVGRVAEQLALPHGVVLVLDGQGFPLGCPAVLAGGVGGGQVPCQRCAGDAVRGDVVDDQDQQVFLRCDAEQAGAQREFGREVEVVGDGLVDRAGQFAGRHVDHRHLHRRLRRGQGPLMGLVVGVGDVDGPQDLVPGDHIADRRDKSGLVQWSRQPERRGDVVGLRPSLQLVRNPHTALCVRQRNHRVTPLRSSGASWGEGARPMPRTTRRARRRSAGRRSCGWGSRSPARRGRG